MAAETTRSSLLLKVRDPANQASWRAFDARYRDLILRFCRARRLQPADAEDVRQLVMMGLARSLPRFVYQRDRGRFRDYLGRVVRHAVTRYLECPAASRRALGGEALDALPDPKAEPSDDAWEREWTHHHFRLALERCRDEVTPQTLAIFERLVVGSSPADVATAFGVSVASVYKIKQRVRNRLKTFIAEQVRAEEKAIELVG
ncbi:MAG: sigma-70 family RNA polymerase sigma factor [Planctomycetota bacterium]